jgi:hypothetical protein
VKVAFPLQGLVAFAAALAVLCCTMHASADVRHYAVVVGNNRGDPTETELRYAETDAQRTYDVLKDLGRFEPSDMVLLRGEDAARAQATIIALNDRIRATIAAGSEALLFVYYSGHAGADALHLSGSRFALTQLEQLVRGSAATFRVLIVDACRSGALTRVKGGHAAPPFDIRIDEHLSEQGLVLLTSASANEDAQESDALKGSFFTHHFVSALLGAADSDGDGRVTLEEAYRYTYDATLRSTSATWAGVQHPTFRYELQGAGKLALTELPVAAQGRATLVFPPDRTYLVMEGSDRGSVVAEVANIARARRLSVRAGRYFVRGRASDTLLEGEIDAAAGSSLEVSDARLRRIAYARLVRKGGGVQTVAHGLEAAYAFRTTFKNANALCQGAFAGYTVHLEKLSLGARLAACHAGFVNDVVRATSDEFGGEIRVAHTWDLPVVSVDLSLGIGGWLLQQGFTTTGVAPSHSTPAGSLGLGLGPHCDLGGGFALFAESALLTYVFAQQQGESKATSLGPHVAVRQAFGVSRVW